MIVKLVRLQMGDQGTFGRLIVGNLALFTGELPDLDNRADSSCIPAGTYDVEWTWSMHFRRKMYLLSGTGGRAGIRIHSANYMGNADKGYKKQLNGCIAFGEKLGTMDGQKALLLSAPAVRRFESYMEYKPFQLEITHAA